VRDSISDRPAFDRLLTLLPLDLREAPGGMWDIGEQEGAMAVLVDALAETRTVVDGVARARIAAMAERCGCWDAVRGTLAACMRGGDDSVDVTERDFAGEELWPGRIAIAWIECRRCDDVLVRVHENEPWGICVTEAYAVVRDTTLLATYDDGLAALEAVIGRH
jgi:hypothetical protein